MVKSFFVVRNKIWWAKNKTFETKHIWAKLFKYEYIFYFLNWNIKFLREDKIKIIVEIKWYFLRIILIIGEKYPILNKN